MARPASRSSAATAIPGAAASCRPWNCRGACSRARASPSTRRSRSMRRSRASPPSKPSRPRPARAGAMIFVTGAPRNLGQWHARRDGRAGHRLSRSAEAGRRASGRGAGYAQIRRHAPDPCPIPCCCSAIRPLTFNGHRIHYDRDYCRDVEGYPGLVVHGPLIATLLVDHFLRAHPAVRVSRFLLPRPASAVRHCAVRALPGGKAGRRRSLGAQRQAARLPLRQRWKPPDRLLSSPHSPDESSRHGSRL